MSTDTKTDPDSDIKIDFNRYTPNYFQYHIYYCLIFRDKQNTLDFFSDRYIKKLRENNLILVSN